MGNICRFGGISRVFGASDAVWHCTAQRNLADPLEPFFFIRKHLMDCFGPPEAGCSRIVDCVMAFFRSTRPPRNPCLATKHEKPVKCFRIKKKGSRLAEETENTNN